MMKNAHLALVAALSASACASSQQLAAREVWVEGIDMDQSISVAACDLYGGGYGSTLALWALRDQKMEPAQAELIAAVYFDTVESIDDPASPSRRFDMWHLGWALSNMYHLGDDTVRAGLQGAFSDVKERLGEIDPGLVNLYFDPKSLMIGGTYSGPRADAQLKMVVPGVDGYLQNKFEYLD